MGTWAKRGLALIFVVDFLAALVLYQQAIIARESIAKPPKPVAIQTFGKVAVQTTWKGSDDVDLYVMAPSGEIAYFGALSIGGMHLEHDDLGSATMTDYEEGTETERVVVRSTLTGEYVVNAQMYGKYTSGPTEVRVTLVQLQGEDKELKTITLRLGDSGDEQTAFRFKVDAKGHVIETNRLPRRLACLANTQDTVACP